MPAALLGMYPSAGSSPSVAGHGPALLLLSLLQVLQQALLRESSSAIEPNSLSCARKPHASLQALTRDCIPGSSLVTPSAAGRACLTAVSKTWGALAEPMLSSVHQEVVLRLRWVQKARPSQFPTLLVL